MQFGAYRPNDRNTTDELVPQFGTDPPKPFIESKYFLPLADSMLKKLASLSTV